ncbi:cytochrome P450 [Russula compacta]|nr:cytochrome P450 [Russula compacta]
MDSLTILFSALLAWPALLAFLYIRARSASLSHLRGQNLPRFGLADLRYQNEVGDCEFKWMREYGTAWRRTGCFGRDHLMLADPKAIQHVLHNPGSSHYEKSAVRARFLELLVGNGLASVRAAVLPSFVPQDGIKAGPKWNDVTAADPSGQPLIDLTIWFSRATLDIIGEAGFDYHFRALDNIKTPLSERYENLLVDTTLYPSGPIYTYAQLSPIPFLPRLHVQLRRGLIEDIKAKSDGKDIMSLLLRANESSDPENRLTESEVIDQITTFLLAGHDTTAVSLSWFFFEMAKHPESQERIRQEIAAVRARSNDEEYTTADLDSMVYTQAALKESLRLYPINWILERVANEDDKGALIDITTPTYNRNSLPEIWGEERMNGIRNAFWNQAVHGHPTSAYMDVLWKRLPCMHRLAVRVSTSPTKFLVHLHGSI